MQRNVKQVGVVVVTLVITVGLLFGAQAFAQRETVVGPLMRMLAQIKSVQHYQVIRKGSSTEVAVKLAPKANLESVYHQVVQTATRVISPSQLQISIQGNTDTALKQVNRTMDFAIQQGIATGDYVKMQQRIQKDAKTAHITASVSIDSSNIYLSLAQGKHNLYQVVPIYLNKGA